MASNAPNGETRGTNGQPAGSLVVVGSSAGGIEALSTLVSTLTENFPAPIVIAQHLDPKRPSHLGEILTRHTPLPVHTLMDHEELTPGVIFVVPADRHVEISDGHISLSKDSDGRPKPSINLLFRSAAQAFGENCIAVILTGAGSDGAAGALEVKEEGGTVVIQDPNTALYPSMPRSLAPSSVDIVADLSELGQILYDLLTGARELMQATDVTLLRALLNQLHERSGIDFTSYKSPTIMRRVQRRIVATGNKSLADYIRYLQQHPDEYQRLISNFLIKVTEFFRDPELFQVLRGQILPTILEEARTRGRELRLWSAGCATGEEAYSLAILIADLLGDDLGQFDVRIFATDLDSEAISFARRGVYPINAFAHMPEELVERYFTRLDGEYEVNKPVRTMMVFGQHDLGQRAPFPRIDMVLCRNVLIYFTAELQRRVLQIFAYSLRDGAYLVLGKAESITPFAELFATVNPALKIYRRQGDRVLLPVGQIRETAALRLTRSLQPASSSRRFSAAPPSVFDLERSSRDLDAPRARNASEKLGSLIFNLPVGVVVVDRRYDVQVINSAAHRLLDIQRAAIGEDLLHLAGTIPTKLLRAVIDAAFRGETMPRGENILPVETITGEQQYLQAQGYPQKFEHDSGMIDSVLLLITDVTAEVVARRSIEQQRREAAGAAMAPAPPPTELEQQLQRQRDEMAQLANRMNSLLENNRTLREANQELTAANVELHQTNEAFVVNIEEVQAAWEEVETLNEELQATNEELETLNEELQATVEELNATNDDLAARSIELQDLAQAREEQRRTSETERARLAAILGSMGDAVLLVDNSGAVVLTNAAYDRLFGADAESLHLEDDEGRPLLPEESLAQRAARGEPFSIAFTLSGQDGARRWYEANGSPVQTNDAHYGVVVIIRDVTEGSLRHIQEMFLSLVSHELRTPLTSALASVQALMKKLPDDDPVNDGIHRYGEIALRQIERLRTLVTDLTDVARLQTGQLQLNMRRMDLTAVVRQTVEAVRLLTETQRIELDAPDAQLWMEGDPARIEQIITNLLTNAMRYAPDSERIVVHVRSLHSTGNRAKGRAQAPMTGMAEVTVRDFGPGIPQKDLPNIFTRFYQAQPGNTNSHRGFGLGLYVVRELVTAHGGTVNVESRPGEGATFTVLLPLLGE